jgi:phage shock protein A
MQYDKAVKKNHDKLIGLRQEVNDLKQKIHEFKTNKAKPVAKPKVKSFFESISLIVSVAIFIEVRQLNRM